ncbi:DUF2254 domain-containing protein [Aureibacillus halotolerans]|uniref:Putative membrane protein n=1 Tax=Aureibacillus halotolerans TaxID=1508390 RepID=A0A4R6UCR2_9BACI|nr:DUF2254 domain-containing protein [Aureibacillus halotolerans]TDQ42913.1 putative membrane protein [Aureibacillus halotolerans]
MVSAKKLTNSIKRFRSMSRREQWQVPFSNLWIMPSFYALGATILFALTAWAEFGMNVHQYFPAWLTLDQSLTQSLLSTLTAGLLSLTSFTFYGVLTAVTAFAAQFSPRILKNFMLHRVTQRTLGIFIGSFLFVLFSLLSAQKETTETFSLLPLMSAFFAVFSLAAFVLFINHIVKWLQINNMTHSMKVESVAIIQQSLLNEVEPHRTAEPDKLQISELTEENGHVVYAKSSGYLKTIDFESLIHQTNQDDVVLKLHYRVGQYVFRSTPLFTYWKQTEEPLNKNNYLAYFHTGRMQTEVQDIEFSINKFVEIAIRALGNDDPKTAIGTIKEIGDLLIHISQFTSFTPYLSNQAKELRLIINDLTYDEYLYTGLASIRHYARGNVVVTLALLRVVNAIAQGAHDRDHSAIWDFAVYTVHGFEYKYMHHLDEQKFCDALYEIANTTDRHEAYEELLDWINQQCPGFSEKEA